MKAESLIKITGAAAVGLAAYALVIRPWHLRWGATGEEAQKPLPGDEFAPEPKLKATHAITIEAPAAEVWPWLLQIGQHRGGFYSYAWIENLLGCRLRNADRIVPEWQSLKVGDPVWLHPKAPPLAVTRLDPGRAIVLSSSWAFVLEPIDEHRTRLIVRGQGDYEPDMGDRVLNFFCWRVVYEPLHFVMERKMLLGIKERAERAYRLRATAPPVAAAAMSDG
jgi:hypothetical protein